LTPIDVLRKLAQGNQDYISNRNKVGDISSQRRIDTVKNGQHPYAVVLTCSDSRVPVEHIFGAGVGDIFVI
jgi:carbonic anhydrase